MNELPSPLERRIAKLESRVAKLVEKLDRKGPQPVNPEPSDHWPQAPEGYRRLQDGEVIEKGDCWNFAHNGPIGVAPEMIGKRFPTPPFLPIIRPIAEPAKPESAAPEGYRRLENGEIIHSGDVWQREFSGPVSVSPQLVGMRYSGLACLPLLRPIAQDPEPIAKPRRSPVEIAKSEMEKWGIEGPLSARNALSNLIAELKREGYE